MIGFFLDTMRQAGEREAIVFRGQSTSYRDLSQKTDEALAWLRQQEIPAGAVVSFDGDYSPAAIALFFALAANRAIAVPLSSDSHQHFQEFRDIAMSEYDVSIVNEGYVLTRTGRHADHPLYDQLRQHQSPGLVLFSSGLTGRSKAIVQNLDKLMAKFHTPRKALRMLIFLQLDHIGGVNSLLYTCANQGTLIVADGRTPEQVCAAIERFQVELLPTSPTFLNLLILSRADERFALSSLKLMTYGTEPMQASTLKKLNAIFPHCQLQQTYGLSELGILRSKWMKVGGKEFHTKIVNGTLWIKSDSAMLGYINAPSPFDAEGYLDTGDLVEQDGDWIRILGRQSEIINVGGAKVYPAEVESHLLEMDNIEDVVIFGETHPITGKIVIAKVKLSQPEPLKEFKKRMLAFCRDRMPSYKVPGKVLLTDQATHNERFKRLRR
ncbi:putative acyl--CoA ligase YhfT [Thiorhodovibrio winogradskyi]|uniref:Acyl--CoA ligase YhfT n=1 Tax=Thiorhodovibrio winogradskyi TaxID=77007 RepID=A0ABZ0S9E1_9GAMM|nr:long-chain fatty acid--CoA ligase [Thiorhodovibrio winogradskyi]